MSFSLAHAALTFAALFYLVLPLRRMKLSQRIAAFIGLLLVSIVPLSGPPIAAYLRGVVGDLAITTMVFLVSTVIWQTLQLPKRTTNQRLVPAAFYAALGLALYPATLGLSAIDPYRWGFEPSALLLICAAATLFFCLRGFYTAGVSLMLATLAFTADMKVSDNYWDYVLDPLLAVYSFFVVIRYCTDRLLQRASASRRKRALAVRET